VRACVRVCALRLPCGLPCRKPGPKKASQAPVQLAGCQTGDVLLCARCRLPSNNTKAESNGYPVPGGIAGHHLCPLSREGLALAAAAPARTDDNAGQCGAGASETIGPRSLSLLVSRLAIACFGASQDSLTSSQQCTTGSSAPQERASSASAVSMPLPRPRTYVIWIPLDKQMNADMYAQALHEHSPAHADRVAAYK